MSKAERMKVQVRSKRKRREIEKRGVTTSTTQTRMCAGTDVDATQELDLLLHREREKEIGREKVFL